MFLLVISTGTVMVGWKLDENFHNIHELSECG